MGAIDTAVNTGLGLALGAYEDKRQLKQQGKLQKQQIQGQMEMGRFNQQLALDTWEKTNYSAQRAQMEKAGINVGLMYGGTGAGGTTQGGAAGNVSGGQAAAKQVDPGMVLQLGLLKAQKENVEADTAKKVVEKTKMEGVDTEKTGAETNNIKAQQALTNLNAELAGIEKEIRTGGKDSSIERIKSEATRAAAEATSAVIKMNIDDASQQKQIEIINQTAQEQGIRMALMQAGIVKTGADTAAVNEQIKKVRQEVNNMIQGNQREWDKMSQTDREIEIRKVLANNARNMTEFNTSTAAQIKQWTEIISDFIPLKGKTSKTVWQNETGSGESTTKQY